MKNQKLPSNRNFGLLFAALFALLAIYDGYVNQTMFYGWVTISCVLLFTSLTAPILLYPLNMTWMKLGEVMGMLVNPLVLGVIFFVILTPVALLGRRFGRDELRLKKINVSSYWIVRAPPGPDGESFKNQF